jgi:hypothetical protein
MAIEEDVQSQNESSADHTRETRLKTQLPTTVKTHRDFSGSFIGILVFLGGVALLVLVFKLAYGMFLTPPAKALNIEPGKKMDLNSGISSLFMVLIRILLLLVMGMVGSWVANRGISLYTQARGIKVHVEEG